LQHPHADLSAYIDQALAPAAQAAVAEHVGACAVCRAHVAELRATVALVHALPGPVPSRRLVPRLTTGPAWLAPLRTVMTIASGTAVFLFIASSLVSNINFLASGAAARPAANEASRDTTTAFQAQGPTASQAGTPAERSVIASAPSPSPFAAIVQNPTAPPVAGAADAVSSPGVDDASKRSVQSSAEPAAPGAGAPQELARSGRSEPARSPLLNPWLWLSLALFTGAIAIALQRRLRRSV
jgi:putative zinc finger protein